MGMFIHTVMHAKMHTQITKYMVKHIETYMYTFVDIVDTQLPRVAASHTYIKKNIERD